MKTLITHINPHLDDICAVWLFKKFHPEFADVQVEFISASHNLAAKEENQDRVFVGTGGGRFDEHKEGLTSYATSLVYEYLKNEQYLPQDQLSHKALEKLINWNLLIDTGKSPSTEFDEFSVQSFIRTKDNLAETSLKSVELGFQILDRILEVLKRKERSMLDWEKRIEFESRFGKSFAVMSETVDREFCREQDGDIFLIYDPKFKSVQFFAPSNDLSPIFEKLKQQNPEADWFLHQSHHMVICGSSSAPEFHNTKLSFEQLIEVVKNHS